jgi:O-methyltransferase
MRFIRSILRTKDQPRLDAGRDRYPDLDHEFLAHLALCQHATLTSIERLYAIYKAIEYILRHNIPGDFAECGVWRGGSVMMMALALRQFGGPDRIIHCFDTFSGMTQPDANDTQSHSGISAEEVLAGAKRDEDDPFWAIAPLDVVKRNMISTGYPPDLVRFHKGRVEETLPTAAPERLALLRLDTDWYASTKHELNCLYPRLSTGGVLIIDDYGYWRGARQATDEYLAETRAKIMLNRIDFTGRIGVKVE